MSAQSIQMDSEASMQAAVARVSETRALCKALCTRASNFLQALPGSTMKERKVVFLQDFLSLNKT